MKTTTKEPTRNEERAPAFDYVSPEVNIFESSDGYVIEAEMPGVNKEGLEITLEGTEITIIGRRQGEAVSGEPLVRERQRADFRRVFEMDPAIDTTKINARITQGVLTLVLPKSEQVKPRRIAVND